MVPAPRLPFPSTPPLAFANPPTLAPTATPTLRTSLAPRLRVDSRIVWAAVAASVFFVVVSAASFAMGVRVSAAGRPPEATTASVASPGGVSGTMGVTNPMPRSEPATPVVALPSLPVETLAPAPGEHVYTPEELPLAPRETKGRHKGR
jgi:hypothetical protein